MLRSRGLRSQPVSQYIIGERERANPVVRTGRFFFLRSVFGHCTYRNVRFLILRTLQVRLYTLPQNTPTPLVFCSLRGTRLSRAITDSAWLSKQLNNGSSRPRTVEAADRGNHAYPNNGLQMAVRAGISVALTRS